MQSITLDLLFSFLINYSFIFLFCLIGAVIRDTYETLTDKDSTVKISRILVSSIVGSIILFSTSDIILERLSLKLFILPCFLVGMMGFDIIGKIKNLNFWIELISNNNVKEALLKSVEEEDKKEEGNDDKKSEENK